MFANKKFCNNNPKFKLPKIFDGPRTSAKIPPIIEDSVHSFFI